MDLFPREEFVDLAPEMKSAAARAIDVTPATRDVL
jgi:hypothetical protein